MTGAYEQYEHIRESYASYLETAYKIADPATHRERADLLRSDGMISRIPFLETTPRFVPGQFLRDLNHPMVPGSLSDLAGLGLTTERFPLYAHQQDAIESAWHSDGTPANYVVASGTGSGKTEAFYLPILADIVRESTGWEAPAAPGDRGRWDAGVWKDARRSETRPAGIRGLILYPTNALVNDQLRRLRGLLNSDKALTWQDEALNGNRIYFGRYTGHTQVPGEPSEAPRRQRLTAWLDVVEAEWGDLSDKLRDSGGWPRLSGTEMLSRWDMQAAPPDILVTNYSMLEYMMIRPVEVAIFDTTRSWLHSLSSHIFTIVIDEAHTYSGARGTEVAYLIRRLIDRLEVPPQQLRCVATSASLGDSEEEIDKASVFIGHLFGQASSSFRIVNGQRLVQTPTDLPSSEDAEMFSRYVRGSDLDRVSALARLAQDLGVGEAPTAEALYSSLEKHPAVIGLLAETAGSSKPLEKVASTLWPDLEINESLTATAGVLAAGAAVRPESAGEVPPLLPSRVHLMFRGIPGVWACSDTACDADPHIAGSAVVGCLYFEPRIWCSCGARVLELMTCRVCGYMFLGGIGENRLTGTLLWPFSEDMTSGLQDHSNYTIFAVSPADEDDLSSEWLDTRSGMLVGEGGSVRRPVWSVARPSQGTNHFPRECPQCGSRRSTTREIIEDLRTSGQTAFAVLVEDAFRLQSPSSAFDEDDELDAPAEGGWFAEAVAEAYEPVDESPNDGRKLIVFSDGRQDAAILAGDLQLNHERDTRRQALLAVIDGLDDEMEYRQLRKEVISILRSRGIDPSFEADSGFRYWAEDRQNGTAEANRGASPLFDSLLRPDITGREIALETLGLGQWLPNLPGDASAKEGYLKASAISGLTAEQGVELRLAVFRLMLTENALAPDGGTMDDWSAAIVPRWARKWVVQRSPGPDSDLLYWHADANNRVVRYVAKVAQIIGMPLPDLLDSLWEPPEALGLYPDPRGAGRAIPIGNLAVSKPEPKLNHCDSCGYISMHTVLQICLRCRRKTAVPTPIENIEFLGGEYYRTIAGYANRGENLPDPFPLRVLEHTAQIDAVRASQRERWFRGHFIRGGDTPETPLQDRVDALSVTTTMEMGIDIGDLNVVGLRNVPPAVANYQQRAGRAGRRSSDVALVLTHARDRSHDKYFFERPDEIITGDVRLPRLHLDNPVIAQRHFNAIVLQRFFASEDMDAEGLFGAFGTVHGFREEALLERLREFITAELDDRFYSTCSRMFVEIHGSDPKQWAAELLVGVDSAVSEAQDDAEVLEVFITEGLLPRYAFPVDVVAFWTREPTKRSYGEEIQRGMQIALSEFAPGAEVIVDKRKYKSAALYQPFAANPSYRQEGWYFECQFCRAVVYEESKSDTSPILVCPECDKPPLPEHSANRAIEPPGFATDWRQTPPRYRGGGRESAGRASRAQLAPGGHAAEVQDARFDERAWIRSRSGRLHIVNRGPEQRPGFPICSMCGLVDKRTREHNRPTRVGDYQHGTQCPGTRTDFNRLVLVHSFQSDVSILAPRVPDSWTLPFNDLARLGARSTWISASTALGNAATLNLQIDPGELAAGTRPWNTSNEIRAEIYLHDTVPNGAGYARDAIENIEEIVTKAIELSLSCPERCATGCYMCLLDYGNQFEHPLLNRYLAADLLQYLRDGSEPSLTSERTSKALDALTSQAPADAAVRVSVTQSGTLEVETPNGKGLVYIAHPFTSDRSLVVESLQAAVVDEFDALHRPFWAWAEVFRALSLV